jgi:hypothetical protein
LPVTLVPIEARWELAAIAIVRFANDVITGSEPMADEPETDRVTIVDTDGGGGSGGVLAVVLLVIVVLVLLFLFRDQLGFGGDKTDINIPDKVEVNVN